MFKNKVFWTSPSSKKTSTWIRISSLNLLNNTIPHLLHHVGWCAPGEFISSDKLWHGMQQMAQGIQLRWRASADILHRHTQLQSPLLNNPACFPWPGPRTPGGLFEELSLTCFFIILRHFLTAPSVIPKSLATWQLLFVSLAWIAIWSLWEADNLFWGGLLSIPLFKRSWVYLYLRAI